MSECRHTEAAFLRATVPKQEEEEHRNQTAGDSELAHAAECESPAFSLSRLLLLKPLRRAI